MQTQANRYQDLKRIDLELDKWNDAIREIVGGISDAEFAGDRPMIVHLKENLITAKAIHKSLIADRRKIVG